MGQHGKKADWGYSVEPAIVFDYNETFLTLLNELSPTSINYPEAIQVLNTRLEHLQDQTFIAWYGKKYRGGVTCDYMVGTASVHLHRKFSHGGRFAAQIEDVVVTEKHRGKGVGAILVEKCVEWASIYNCYKISLSCAADNVEFYTKLGFRQHEVYMRMDL